MARQQAAQGGTCDTTDTSWATTVALADGEVLAGSVPLGVAVSPAVTLTLDALGRTDLGTDFDDVDDYHGLADSEARDQFGTGLAPLSQYTLP